MNELLKRYNVLFEKGLIKHAEMVKILDIDSAVFYRWRVGNTQNPQKSNIKRFEKAIIKLENLK